LEAAKWEIEAAGGSAIVIPADVADAGQLDEAADLIERNFGPIDVWVNNAMATIFAPFVEITSAEFKRATEVTYLGYVYGTMAALKRMKTRNSGVIVQVGSALAYRSIPLQSAYCGAKHAIIGFTDSIRSELIHSGSHIHLTVVNLPAMNTPQFEWSRTRLPRHPQPVPPIYQPEIAANAIVWAAYHPRREVDVGLPTVIARNVQKMAPGFADRYLAASAFKSQQTAERVRADRPDNLFSPVPGEYGAHGAFDWQAQRRSVQFWLNRNRWVAVVGTVAVAGLTITSLERSQNERKNRSKTS
jgi:NAD(P)-dependent dehydrogenase (short-subunit alcohol dehydrogenase family)